MAQLLQLDKRKRAYSQHHAAQSSPTARRENYLGMGAWFN
jgi:hypothetical protein